MTNSAIKFRTKYIITPVSSLSGVALRKPTIVCNTVLNSGLAALGDLQAYKEISLGSSSVPTNVSQVGLLEKISEANISEALTTHNVNYHESDDLTVISTTTHEIMFKNFQFPLAEKTVDVAEIGLSGVTRAVLPEPIRVGILEWVAVKVIVEVVYIGSMEVARVDVNKNIGVKSFEYTVEPYIYNPKPTDKAGRGYGGNSSVICRVWDGSPIADGYSGVTTPNITIVGGVDKSNNCWSFEAKGGYDALLSLKGFVVIDMVYGGAYLIRLTGTPVFEEDDVATIKFSFGWGR